MKLLKNIIIPVFLFLSLVSAAQESEKTLVYKFNIKEEITRATWRQTQQAFEAADTLGAKYFLIHMNTYGGTVVDADSIRTKILESKIPVLVFIDNNAASAGALIAIACDSIYMRPGSSIGAATVVNQSGEAMPDKYQSYMRSTMRATAEAKGKDITVEGRDTVYRWRRDPQIAEAMVDPQVFIEGLSEVGKILSFTPSEAVANGYCEDTADNIEEVLLKAGIGDCEIVEYQPSWIERIIGWLVHPVVSGILIMAVIGGIYFEMQTPGIGFPLTIAAVAAVAYFAPLYLEGLAANWEIALFVVGVLLLAIEIFAIPGFGIPGIAGVALIFAGLVLSLINNVDFDFKYVYIESLGTAMLTVVLGIASGFVLSLGLANMIFSSSAGAFRNMALNTVQDTGEGFISMDTALFGLKNKRGTAVTVLRPGGKVEIEGNVYDAVAENGFVDRGESIRVVKVESAQVYVARV